MKEPCADRDCGNGLCMVVEGAAACVCDPGFVVRGGRCESACEPTTCSGLINSLCRVEDEGVRCVCPDSRVEVDGGCVIATACTPNPCTAPWQTRCEEVSGIARCECDEGHAPFDGGCSRTPQWDCNNQHAGDSAEPDECPSLAKSLPLDVDAARTMSPEADHDWFRIGVTPGTVFAFDAAGSVPLIIEVFKPNGALIISRQSVRAIFVAPAGEPQLFVRVRAESASVRGDYTARFTEIGVDDFPNEVTNAPSISVEGNGFLGNLQYEGDVDVVRLQLPARQAIELTASPGVALFDIIRTDGTFRVLDDQRTSVTVPTAQEVQLVARPRAGQSVGVFELQIASTGADDHSEDVLFATPIANGGTVTGVLEHDDDIDTFVVQQQLGDMHVVRFPGQDFAHVSAFDALGTLIGESDWAAGTLTWPGTMTGPVSLQVAGFHSNDAGMPYSISFENLGVDDHGDVNATATTVAANSTTNGVLSHRDDVDVFAVNAAANDVIFVTSAEAIQIFDAQMQPLTPARIGFVAARVPTAGTYFVWISVRSVALPSSYTVQIQVGPDDHGNASTPTPLTLATAASGTLQFEDDVDAFEVQAVARHVYRVTCGVTCAFTVTDASGQHVSTNGTPANIALMARANGPMKIEVATALGHAFSGQTNFTVQVDDLGPEDHGETAATATPLTVGAPMSGMFAWPGDVDVFSFEAVAGHRYAVLSTQPPRMNVRDEQGMNVSLGFRWASFIAATSGTFTLELTSNFGSSYAIELRDFTVDDHGNTFATGSPLALSTSVDAIIESATDVDVLTFSAETARFYTLTKSQTCSARIIDTTGTTLLQLPPFTDAITFKTPSGHTSLGVELSAATTPEFCTVRVEPGALDDHGDTVADATPLTLGNDAGVPGAFQTANDADAFSMALDAGEILQFVARPISPAVPNPPISGQFVSPSGFSTTFHNNRGAIVVQQAGTWTAIIRNTSGSYEAFARKVVDDIEDTTPSPLTLGTPKTFTIDHPSDVDCFSVQLIAGTAYTFSGFRLPFATLSPPGGQTTYLNASPTTFTAATTGTHTICALLAGIPWTPEPYTILVQ